MYARIARWCFHHPWQIIGGWVALLILSIGITGAIGTAYDGSFSIPDSESRDGSLILDEYFGGLGGGQAASIVFEAPQGVDDPVVQSSLTGLFDQVRTDAQPGGPLDGIVLQSPYEPGGEQLIAPATSERAGEIAMARLSISADVDQTVAAEMGVHIRDLVDESGAVDIEGVRVEVGGAILGAFEPPESELLGIAFAVVILIVAMGSVIAMGTTIGVALIGVGIGAISIGLVSHLMSVPDFATTIGLMIGLGVGIDYALFIVTRYREALRDGFDPESATIVALDTAGRSVIFAGATVVVSLLGLLLIGLAFITGLGVGAALTVSIVVMSSVTLLPAMLGIVQERVNITRRAGMAGAVLIALGLLFLGLGLGPVPLAMAAGLTVIILLAAHLPFVRVGALRTELPPRKEVPPRETIWYRWSRTIQARPWLYAIGATTLLVVLSLPLFSLRLGFSDEGNYQEETTTRHAYDLISEGFGAGANGPLLVVTELNSPADLQVMKVLSTTLNETEGIAFASPPFPNDPDNPQAALIQIQPTTSPQDEATENLVFELRDTVVPSVAGAAGLDAKVAGATAANIDFTDFLGGRILLFFGVVLTLSFLLLMVVFRSILVPLKAVIMNMLSIGAAYGIVVAVFQWGWFGSVFGIEAAPIEPFIPMMMFAILFGLSMDYEVFILSRMKEEYERTGDAENSVADGLAKTARVITAAAAIMAVVFGSFVFEGDRIIKLFGLGLASAVLIDASIVRMLLVPSTMQLLGDKNWWLPGWLDRILPNLNIEGGHHEPPTRDTGTPAEPVDVK